MHTLEVPKKPAERRAWIKYQLALRGTSLARLARDRGLYRTAVQTALFRAYPKSERVISDAIGLTPAQLWPERYDDAGRPNRRRGRPLVKKSLASIVVDATWRRLQKRLAKEKQNPQGRRSGDDQS